MCLLFIEQSVVLFNWKQGVTLRQWTGHSRDVTKVSIYAVFSLSCMILTLLFQTHFLISFWQSMVEEASAGFSFLIIHTFHTTESPFHTQDLINFPHTLQTTWLSSVGLMHKEMSFGQLCQFPPTKYLRKT